MKHRIREAIADEGLSIAEVARRIGIRPSSLYSSIDGNPTLDMLYRIADAIEVPITELFQAPAHQRNCPHCNKPLRIIISK